MSEYEHVILNQWSIDKRLRRLKKKIIIRLFIIVQLLSLSFRSGFRLDRLIAHLSNVLIVYDKLSPAASTCFLMRFIQFSTLRNYFLTDVSAVTSLSRRV